MPRYRYQLCDLPTDDHLAWLPLQGVSFDRRIVQAGSFSARMPIANRQLSDLVAKVIPRREDDLSTGPGRCVIYVWRGDEIWGCYVVWRGRVSGDDRGRASVQLSGAHLESLLDRMTLFSTLTYSGWDQLIMVRDMVNEVQSDGIGYPQFALGGPATSGINRDRTYSGGDNATLGRRLIELSEVINGPEWYIRAYPDGSDGRVREFYAADVIGQASTQHVFAQPGNILSWRYSGDATETGTYYYARGDEIDSGSGKRAEFSAIASAHDFAGWPRLDSFRDYPTVIQVSTLVDYADWWATYRGGATYTLEATVRLPETPTLTPDRLGDYARLTMVNEWWPLDEQGQPTMDQWRRVIGMEVRPPDRGDGQETATLLFETPRDDAETGTPRGSPLYPPDVGQQIARTRANQHMILSSARPFTS